MRQRHIFDILRVIHKGLKIVLLFALINSPFISVPSFGQMPEVKLSFHHLKPGEQLSEGTNAWIHRDQSNFVWLSSLNGLNRFDGKSTKVYTSIPGDTTTIHDNIITSNFYEDANGNLWFTSYGALNVHYKDRDEFQFFQLRDSNGEIISEDYHAFHMDPKQNVWLKIGIKEKGALYHFDINKKEFNKKISLQGNRQEVITSREDQLAIISYFFINDYGLNITSLSEEYKPIYKTYFSEKKNSRYPNAQVNDVDVISENEIILSTSLGLIYLNQLNGEFEIYSPPRYNQSPEITSTEVRGKTLFVGTPENGLYIFDKKTKNFTQHFFSNQKIKYQLRYNGISNITLDYNNGLWISYYGAEGAKGVDYSDLDINRFQAYSPFSGQNFSQSTIISNPDNSVFVHNKNEIYSIDLFREATLLYQTDNQIVHLLSDKNQALWSLELSSSQRGELIQHTFKDGIHSTRIPIDFNFTDLTQTNSGEIFLTSYAQGIYSFNPGQESTLQKRSDFPEINNEPVFKIFADNKDHLFFSVNYDRIVMYQKSNGKYQYTTAFPSTGHTPSYLQYDQNNIWAATSFGVSQINTVEGSNSILSNQIPNFPDLPFKSILKDNNGSIWLKNEFNLYQYQPSDSSIFIYGEVDGVQSSSSRNNTMALLRNGTIWATGQQAFNVFHPDSIHPLSPPPAPIITKILINEEPLKTDFDHSTINQLDLSFNERTLAFEFVSCDYSDPKSIIYQYRLEGYDNQWLNNDDRNFIRYSSLPSGHYHLEIRSGRQGGKWSKSSTSISITINPPWWASTWAYVTYSILFLSLLYYIWWQQSQKQKRKLQLVQQRVDQERRVNAELRKVDKLKDQFLANTSHELRTPLNGIIGLAESLIDGASGPLAPSTKNNLGMIVSSGIRLSHLVNDILDFSRLKNNDLHLDLKSIDLHSAVDVVISLLSPLRKDESILLLNEVPAHTTIVLADENRLQQILYNLIGNAIKFTHQGEIKIVSTPINDQVKIGVLDTGIGIEADKFESIFRSFEQGDGTTTREYSGTGLGLSVTKKLVELHQGSIEVQSSPGIGSRFFFTLKKSDQPASNSDLNYTKSTLKTSNEWNETINAVEEKIHSSPPQNNSEITILVIDDEPINRKVVENHLNTSGYQVIMANDGLKVSETLKNQKVDLMLLDIMMPGLSGFEVCRQVRQHHSAITLPIIMLTAKNQIADLVKGFTVGANDYLAKPFSKDELLARIQTHLSLTRIYKASGKFVPYEFLSAIGHSQITDVNLGDHKLVDVTVLFADIRKFTQISETLSPAENFAFVQTYVARMGPIIQANGGFVNQYLGDGIMAIFPNSSNDAITAAHEMISNIHNFNEEKPKYLHQNIQVGIGMHTGPLIMGIIGDANRSDPATISDTVNVSSRLESLTKYYKANVIVSKETLRNVPDDELKYFRYLGEVTPAGKKIPIEIYELIKGDTQEILTLKQSSIQLFDEGIQFYQSKELEKAQSNFKKIIELNPKDAVSHRFYDKINSLLEEGVPEEWDPVENMTKK